MTIDDSLYVKANRDNFHIPLTLYFFNDTREIQLLLNSILIELENNEDWKRSCPCCYTLGWDILSKLITVTSNSIIANNVKNVNSVLLANWKIVGN